LKLDYQPPPAKTAAIKLRNVFILLIVMLLFAGFVSVMLWVFGIHD
jgi:hypothetical protein